MVVVRHWRFTPLIDKYLRLATPDDVPTLVAFARKFHEASPYKGLKFAAPKVYEAFDSVTRGSLKEGVVILALDDDKPIGFIAGVVTETLFSGDRIATELAWWIEEDHRSTRASLLIYNAYDDWAKRVQCVAVQGAYLPGVGTDLKEFYEKRNYRQVETSYMKVL